MNGASRSATSRCGFGGCICSPVRLLVWAVNVEPILGNIDTNKKFLHHVPCPVLRGLSKQPQSTVQDNIKQADGSQATKRDRVPEQLRDAVRTLRLPYAG